MVRERVIQKKSFQQSLDDIKEKMKEKRQKRLASASTVSRGLSKLKNTASVKPLVLKSVQVNNRELALALQSEREKVRQAQGIILQLKRERQTLIFHLLMMKRALSDEGVAGKVQTSCPDQPVLSQPSSPRAQAKAVTQEEDLHPITQPDDDGAFGGSGNVETFLPPSVGTRRQREGRKRSERRRSSLFHPAPVDVCVAEDADPQKSERAAECHVDTGHVNIVADVTENKATTGGRSSLRTDSVDISRSGLESELPDLSAEQHSTPEPLQRCVSRQTKRKTTRSATKTDRGRKVERVPLKKPWEKPRARSKSRPAAAAGSSAPSDRLNSSLGGNDTFDFDCEEAIHVTPFRGGAKSSEAPPSPIPMPSPVAPPTPIPAVEEPSSSEAEQDADDSLYVPDRKFRLTSEPLPRRTRSKRKSAQTIGKENTGPKQNRPGPEHMGNTCAEVSDLILKTHTDIPQSLSADPHFSDSLISPLTASEKFNQSTPNQERAEAEKEILSPLPDLPAEGAGLMMIDSPLFQFTNHQSQSQAEENNMAVAGNKSRRRKGGLVVHSCLGLALRDVTNLSPAAYQAPLLSRDSTPGLTRKRRCTSIVSYKEPSVNSKLRRGDKFTDTRFLRSPIFKQKSRRSSKAMEKYNESFVGCC